MSMTSGLIAEHLSVLSDAGWQVITHTLPLHITSYILSSVSAYK